MQKLKPALLFCLIIFCSATLKTGSNEKIQTEIKWSAEIPLEKSLRDILNYYIEDDDNSKKNTLVKNCAGY